MNALRSRRDFGARVLMDMIGYSMYKRDDENGPARRDRIFQINPGYSTESKELAQVAMAVSRQIGLKPALKAEYRDPFALDSYLYNTDGIIFAWGGYPVVLFNEHMNRYNISRPDYHELSDTVDKIDWDYVTFVAKTAIETAAQMADQ
jgi:hypothetical protein